jgi:hypothetical protein
MTATTGNVVDADCDSAMKGRTAILPPRPFVSQIVYSTFYFASYGIVFPALLVANVVPGLGAIGDGLADGTFAACDAVRQRKGRRASKNGAASVSVVQ